MTNHSTQQLIWLLEQSLLDARLTLAEVVADVANVWSVNHAVQSVEALVQQLLAYTPAP